MAKREKRKGYRGENELENLLKEYGIKCKRIPLSGADKFQKGDLLLEPNIPAEVKRRRRISRLFYDALSQCPIAFIRADRKPWLVMMDLEFFVRLWNAPENFYEWLVILGFLPDQLSKDDVKLIEERMKYK